MLAPQQLGVMRDVLDARPYRVMADPPLTLATWQPCYPTSLDPASAAVLLKEKASPNKWGEALLNEAGRPLLRHDPHVDSISRSYQRLQNRTSALHFKQFRKIGATAIQRIGGDEARPPYKAGTVGEGDRVYVRGSYEKLVPHLMAWGNELRRDGALS